MMNDFLTLVANGVRGTDSNSLLRRYDQIRAMLRGSPTQHDRSRAEKAIQRIAQELQKRNVRP